MSKNTINVPHFKSEFIASNPTIDVIVSEYGIGIEFLNQWFTNPEEITKKLFPTSFFKTAWDEVVIKFDKIHKSLLNNWSLLKVLVVSLKVLGGAKPSLIHVFPLVTMLSSGFSFGHLQNRVANTTKQSTKSGNKLD